MTGLRCLAVRPSQAQTNTHPGSPCLRETHYSEQAELFGGDHTAGPRGLRRRGSAILPRARQIFRAESRTRCIPSYTASGLHHPAQSPPCGPAGRMGACGRMTLPGRQAIAGAGIPPSVFMIPARSSAGRHILPASSSTAPMRIHAFHDAERAWVQTPSLPREDIAFHGGDAMERTEVVTGCSVRSSGDSCCRPPGLTAVRAYPGTPAGRMGACGVHTAGPRGLRRRGQRVMSRGQSRAELRTPHLVRSSESLMTEAAS